MKFEPSAKTMSGVNALVDGFSIEVMPRTAQRVEDFRAILPLGTRVYIAHIEGTPIDEMVGAAKRIAAEGFEVMPHITARAISCRRDLEALINRYQSEAGIHQALLLAGGMDKPIGEFHSSIQLLRTGLFDRAGFKRLHVAGHPEGSKDIDPTGGHLNSDAALLEKQNYSRQSDAEMEITTQFLFESSPVLRWASRIHAAGVTLPINIGIAGPAKLQTLIKYALACGVGPSLRVLHRRAADISKLLAPFEPTELVSQIASALAENPLPNIAGVHVFPLGGIRAGADWGRKYSAGTIGSGVDL